MLFSAELFEGLAELFGEIESLVYNVDMWAGFGARWFMVLR